MGWNPATDAWLSGFTDGEGHFRIARAGSAQNRHLALAPHFAIGLHVKDKAVLAACQAVFGGGLSVSGPSRNQSCHCATWTLASRDSLVAITGYFERFPLHSGKAIEFETWRAAVDLYTAVEEGWRAYPRMCELRDELVALRHEASAKVA